MLVVLIIILIFFQGLSYPTRLLQWLARCSFDPVLFEQWEDVCRAELLSFVFFGDVGTSIRFRCQTQVVDACWCIDVLLFCEQVGTNLEELDLPFKWCPLFIFFYQWLTVNYLVLMWNLNRFLYGFIHFELAVSKLKSQPIGCQSSNCLYFG